MPLQKFPLSIGEVENIKKYREAVPTEPSSPGAVQLNVKLLDVIALAAKLETWAGGVVSAPPPLAAAVVPLVTFEIADVLGTSSLTLRAK
jgi:hypothetical protein